MRCVNKYPIPATKTKFGIILPVDWKFLRVSWQQNQLMLWAEVDNEKKTEQTNFQTFGTSHEIPAGHVYLTSFEFGPFMMHLYQI